MAENWETKIPRWGAHAVFAIGRGSQESSLLKQFANVRINQTEGGDGTEEPFTKDLRTTKEIV